jgi:bifunctional UDP-N-acetylglucosamine pyrophosphorylase/glucosamine-1-phosphate N-acetyltransferase
MIIATARFDAPTRVADEQRLRALFGTERLNLDRSASVIFDGEVALGQDIAFSGDCILGPGTAISQGGILTDVKLGHGNRVRPYSILTRVEAGDRNLFGPFCFIRDGCIVADDCIVGAHVEAARSAFASGVKISHRAFIGDAQIGEHTIIGAGVVFCNWDGTGRQATHVGAKAVIGSGSLLVPPLRVGEGATIGAGSTITRDVPAGAKIIQKRS